MPLPASVGATIPVSSVSWPRWPMQRKCCQWMAQPCRLGAVGLPGTSHLDGGWGARWAPCLQEMYTDGWSLLPTKWAAGGDRLQSIRGDKKEVHWNFSKMMQIKEPENPTDRGEGRICAYLDVKRRIPWWPRLEACDFWHQKDVFCSPCKSATTEDHNEGGKWQATVNWGSGGPAWKAKGAE